MKRGDHLVSPRLGYAHHGLYLGDDQVIHYSGFVNGFTGGEIEIASLDKFRNGNEIKVKMHKIRSYDREESIERAYSRLGEDWYSVLLNNCEHFVTWCIVGISSSSQVNNLILSVALPTKAVALKSSATLVCDGLSVASGKLAATRVGQQLATEGLMAAAKIATTTSATGGLTTGIVSSSIGTASGIATGVGLTSGVGAGVVGAAGIAGGVAVAPVAATVAVAVGVGYGVKELVDWIWD